MFGDPIPEQQAEADPSNENALDDMFGGLTISSKPEENVSKPATDGLFGASESNPSVSPGMEQLNDMYNQSSQPISNPALNPQTEFGAPGGTSAQFQTSSTPFDNPGMNMPGYSNAGMFNTGMGGQPMGQVPMGVPPVGMMPMYNQPMDGMGMQMQAPMG